MERKRLLELAGYTVDTMRKCEWNALENTLSNKAEIEDKAQKQNIRTRDALCGGRTEAFTSYFKCNKHHTTLYLDVCSLYPTVNALDGYAVGFNIYADIAAEDILSDNFVGLVKSDIEPPSKLYVPVLPDNPNGKLLFHSHPMKETA